MLVVTIDPETHVAYVTYTREDALLALGAGSDAKRFGLVVAELLNVWHATSPDVEPNFVCVPSWLLQMWRICTDSDRPTIVGFLAIETSAGDDRIFLSLTQV